MVINSLSSNISRAGLFESPLTLLSEVLSEKLIFLVFNSRGRYNNNRYGVEERDRKQALSFIDNKPPKQNQHTTK